GSAGAARHTEALRELPQVLLEATRPGTCRRAVTFRTCSGTSTSAASIQHLSLERREQALAAGRGPQLHEADQLPAASSVLVQLVGEVAGLAGQRRRGHARKLPVLPLALGNEPSLGTDPGLGRGSPFNLLSTPQQGTSGQ